MLAFYSDYKWILSHIIYHSTYLLIYKLGLLRLSMIESSGIVCEKRKDGIYLIKINRPSKKNAINSPTARLLLEAVKDFEQSDCKVAILHGGDDFCAGFDLG